jgi:2-(1,2-epoxy-1,2-dihydrophenyl)acetyl-CoA isomerase
MADELISSVDGPVYRITLNRPARRNALTPALARELARRLDALEDDGSVQLAVISGTAGQFCAGLDLHWLRSLEDAANIHDLQRGLGDFQAAVLAVARCPVPVIAAVQGYAAGFGLDLVLACDLRIAGTSARFTSAFARMALVPDGGSTFTLPRLVGLGPALRILMAGETVDAARAHAIGLVDEVVEDGSLEQAVAAMAEKLFVAAPASIRAIKRLVRAGELGALEQTLATEGAAQLQALQSPEFQRRLRAFLAD